MQNDIIRDVIFLCKKQVLHVKKCKEKTKNMFNLITVIRKEVWG